MAMVAEKAERLLNLVILLLVARNYTTKEQIRALMEPYRASSDEAFDRMFERDKDELRALGIPLETGYVDKFFEDEQGYRIERDAFELPSIDFTADEVAVLGLAGCEPTSGPTATCFNLAEGQGPCEFHPLPGRSNEDA